jgi:hypothetical protein
MQSVFDNGGIIGQTMDFASTEQYSYIGIGTVARGEVQYTTPGTYSWTAPANCYSVCVVAVGGGGGSTSSNGSGGNGGAGGGLGWKNNIPVVPGNSYTVVVGSGGAVLNSTTTGLSAPNGGNSYFIDTSTVAGFGGTGGVTRSTSTRAGGSYVGDGGGNGGNALNSNSTTDATGGGGAGGYSGNGGNGAPINTSGSSGSGGGGGGGGAGGSADAAGAGGGVGLQGEGSSGSGGSYNGANGGPGGGGSGGSAGSASTGSTSNPSTGGNYGGGGGGAENTNENGPGAGGAVRIIYGGNRAFPSTNTADGLGDTTAETTIYGNYKNSGIWKLSSVIDSIEIVKPTIVSIESVASSTSININANAVAGDLLIIQHSADGNTSTFPAPTGFTDVYGTSYIGDGNWTNVAYYKILTESDISSGTISVNPSDTTNGIFLNTIIRNATQATGYATTDLTLLASSITLPSVTPSSGNKIFIAVAYVDDDFVSISSYPTDFNDNQNTLAFGTTPGSGGGTLSYATTTSTPLNTNTFTWTGIADEPIFGVIIEVS